MTDKNKLAELERDMEASLKLEQFTVSHGFDTYRGGQKQSHFVSANFTPPPGLDAANRKVAFLVASKLVTKMAIHTAVARGSLSVDEANDVIRDQSDNHSRLIAKIAGVTSGE